MKKFRIFAIVAALLIAICCVFSGCSQEKLGIDEAQKNPLSYLQAALAKTQEATGAEENSELNKLLEALSEKGSISITYSDQGFTLSGAIAYHCSKGVAQADLSVTGSDEAISFSLYGSSEVICLKCPVLLGDTYYGFSLKTIKEDLPQCPLWAMAGIDYSTIRSQVEAVLDQLEQLTQATDSSLNQKVEQAAEKVKLIYNEIQYSAVANGSDSVDIICTMTKEQMGKLVDIWVDDVYKTVMDSLGQITDQNLAPSISQIREQLKDACGDVTVKATISNDNGQITALNARYELTMYGTTLAIALDADLSNIKDISLTLQTEINGEVQESTVCVNIKNNDSGKNIDRRLIVKVDGEETGSLSYTYDGTNLALNITSMGQTVASLECKCSYTSKKMELSDLTLVSDGQKTELPITLVLDTSGKVGNCPTYANLLTMSQEEWAILMEKISSFLPIG